jgi:hypothetical protein
VAVDEKRIHNMARHLAFTRALHECPEEVAKDLEQAAWIKFLTLKSEKYLWKDLEYAMLEELSRWIWACKRGRGRTRILRFKVSLDEILTRLNHGWTPRQLMRERDLERFEA